MSALPGDPGREMNIGRCRGYHAATSLPGGCLFSTDDCTPELCDCQHSNDQFTYLGGMPTLWLEFQVGTITVRVASGTPRLIRGGSAIDQNPFPHTAEPKGGCRPTSGHIRHWAGGLHPCHATGRRADDLCPAGCWRCRAARLTPAGRAAAGRLRRLGWVRSIGSGAGEASRPDVQVAPCRLGGDGCSRWRPIGLVPSCDESQCDQERAGPPRPSGARFILTSFVAFGCPGDSG